MIEGAAMLLDHASGGTPLALTEVELGIGRPDVILVAADPNRLTLRLAAGLRLANLSEALVLEALSVERALEAASTDYRRRVVRRLADHGWFDPTLRSPVVQTSLLLEAKISAWREGVRQLSRVRWGAHRAALVLPKEVARRVRADHLRRTAVGLLAVDDAGDLAWRRQSPVSDLPFYVDAWLGELTLRALETA